MIFGTIISRLGARPVLIAVALAATVGGVIATRGDDTEVFFAGISIDAPILVDSPPDPDVPIDTPTDAPPVDSLDFEWPSDWFMITIHGPEADIGLDGADGVDTATIGGKLTVTTPWEQSGAVTVSTRNAGGLNGLGAWSTIALATVVQTEDAKFCDVDGDGALDVMAGGQGKRIRIWFGPSPYTTTLEIAAATNLQQWMQLACTSPASKTVTVDAGTDVITATAHGWSTGDLVRGTTDGTLPAPLALAANYFVIRTGTNTFKLADARATALAGSAIDIIDTGTGTHTLSGGMRVWGGGRPGGGTNPQVGYFYSGTPRSAGAWTFVPIAPVTWLMSLVPGDFDGDGDLDALISERQASVTGGIKGSKWYRFESDGTWTTNNIYNFNGQGDPKFLSLQNATTVLIGGGSDTRPNKLVKSVTADNWATWTHTTITPYPSGSGWYHAVAACDVTGDSVDDYVITHSSATGSSLGVLAIDGADHSTVINIDHADGEKYDNVICLDMDGDGDMDVLTSEQNEGLGKIWFMNPRLHP